MKAIIVEQDGTVNIRNIKNDISEISAMFDGGFVCAILRVNNGKIEYAHVDYNKYSYEYTNLIWEEIEEIKEE